MKYAVSITFSTESEKDEIEQRFVSMSRANFPGKDIDSISFLTPEDINIDGQMESFLQNLKIGEFFHSDMLTLREKRIPKDFSFEEYHFLVTTIQYEKWFDDIVKTFHVVAIWDDWGWFIENIGEDYIDKITRHDMEG